MKKSTSLKATAATIAALTVSTMRAGDWDWISTSLVGAGTTSAAATLAEMINAPTKGEGNSSIVNTPLRQDARHTGLTVEGSLLSGNQLMLNGSTVKDSEFQQSIRTDNLDLTYSLARINNINLQQSHFSNATIRQDARLTGVTVDYSYFGANNISAVGGRITDSEIRQSLRMDNATISKSAVFMNSATLR